MPANLKAPAQMAVADLVNNSKNGSPALQAGIRHANHQGQLTEFIEAVNKGLQDAGLKHLQLEEAQARAVPGMNAAKMFVLRDSQTGRDIDQIGPIFRPAQIPGAAPTENPLVSGKLNESVIKFAERGKTAEDTAKNRKDGIDTLTRTGSDPELVKDLKALDAAAKIHETDKPADAAAQLKRLSDLNDDGSQEASQRIKALTKKLGGEANVKQLIADLNKDGTDGKTVLTKLKDALPKPDSTMDNLRARAIMQELPAEPTYQNLVLAQRKLDAEAKLGNQAASDFGKRTSVDLIVKQLEFGQSVTSAEKLVGQLGQRARDGDVHARRALAAIVAPGGAEGKAWQSMNKFGDNSYATDKLPDFSTESPEWQARVKLKAVKALRESGMNNGGLNPDEVTALALTLKGLVNSGDAEKGDGSRIVDEIRGAFYDTNNLRAKEDKGREKDYASRSEKLLAGLNQVLAIESDPTKAGTRELIIEYSKAAQSENNRFVFDHSDKGSVARVGDVGQGFRKQVEDFESSAKKGNKVAIDVLATMAGGVGKHNTLVNPTTRTKENPYKDSPSSDLAYRARRALVETATQSPELRKTVMDSLTSTLQTKAIPDRSMRQETLGQIAALNPKDIPDKVRETLRAGLKNPETHAGAVNGMMAMAKHLDSKDIEALRDHLSPHIVEHLRTGSFKLSPERGAQLANLLASDALDTYKLNTPEKRVQSIKALAAIGPYHATDTSISALQSLGGDDGRKLIDAQLRVVDKVLDWNQEKREVAVNDIQSAAGSALLTIAERAPDSGLKTTAFNAFAGQDWGKSFKDAYKADGGQDLRSRLQALMRDNPENVAIQGGVPKLAYRLNHDVIDYPREANEPPRGKPDAARIGAAFKDKGTQSSDEVLGRFSELAIGRYGLAKVREVSDNLAIFNALPPDVRRQLTSFSGRLEEGKDLSLTGTTMSAQTFNKLPADLRKLLTGKEDLLPSNGALTTEQLKGKTISGATFNNFSPELRKELSGSEATLPTPQSLSLWGRTVDAATFNKLPADMRKQLFGSDALIPEPKTLSVDKRIGASEWNQLPIKVREMLSSDGKGALASNHGVVEVKGKTIDARTFNRLSDEQRRILSDSTWSLEEGSAVPDLSRVKLTAEQFNRLSVDAKQALGQKPENVPPGSFVSLAGQTLDAATVNKLPRDVREAITGSPAELAAGRVLRDLSQTQIDAKTFNALPGAQKLALTGTTERLDAAVTLGQLASGEINKESALAHVLLGPPPLDTAVDELRVKFETNSQQRESELQALIRVRENVIRELGAQAKEGVGWLNKLGASIYDGLSVRQRNFIQAQSDKIFNIQSLDKAIQDQGFEAQMAKARVQTIEIAQHSKEHARLTREGKLEQADRYALTLFTTYGRPLLELAPDMSRSLRRAGDGTNSGAMGRSHESGHTQFATLQFNTKIGQPGGVEQGLQMLASVKAKESGDGKRAPLMFADAPAIRAEAFRGIDSDPTVRKLNELAQVVNDQLSTLNTEITSMQSRGDRFQDFIDDANRRANIVKEALNGLNPADIKRLNEVHQAMAKSLRDGSIIDPEAKQQIQKRFDALDKALMLFDPNYDKSAHQQQKLQQKTELEAKVKSITDNSWNWARTDPPKDSLYDALYKRHDHNVAIVNHQYWAARKGEALKNLQKVNGELNQRHNIEKMIDFLASPEAKDESTFGTWMKRDGVELIGAAAGAAIATGLVIATFGTAVPALALAATGTLGFIAGREITKEAQHGAGNRSDGSLPGDYARGRTLMGEDGLERPMEFDRDVLTPFGIEFGVGTLIGWAGGGAGTYIGQNLRNLSSSARALFVAENKQAIQQLTRSISQLEAQAAKQPWLATFANQVLKETAIQSAVLPTFMATEHGAQHTLKSLGLAVQEGNMITSFLAATAVSVPFGLMKARVLPRDGRVASHGEIKPVEPLRPGEPNLRLSHEATPQGVDGYVQNAKSRGSNIEMKGNGRFIETTKEGLVVEWSPHTAESAGVGKPTEIPLRQAASLAERPGAKLEVDAPKPDPVQAKRLQEKLDAMLKPVAEKESASAKLERDYRTWEIEMVEKMDRLPETKEGDLQFNEMNRQLRDRKLEFERQKETLRRETDDTKRQIEDSDSYKQLKMAHILAEGNFPPGEYQLRINGQDGIKLYVGMEPYLKDGKVATRLTGEPVPIEHVNQILKSLEGAKLKPESVVINNKPEGGTEGALTAFGNTYELSINTGSEQPIHLIYNHETGHLYDFRGFRPGADLPAQQKVMDAYKAMLLKEGGPADMIARRLGKEPTAEFRERLAKELTEPENFDFLSDRTRTPEGLLKYLASRGEVFAEMYKLHQEKTRIKNESGKEPTYEELLKEFTGRYSPNRAEMMKPMGDVFKALEENAFNAFKVSDASGSTPTPKSSGTAPSLPRNSLSPVRGELDALTANLKIQVDATRIDSTRAERLANAVRGQLEQVNPAKLQELAKALSELPKTSDGMERLSAIEALTRSPENSGANPGLEVLLKSETSLQTLKAVRKFLDRPGMRDALKRDPSIARGLNLAMESPTLADATVSGDMMALQAVKTLGEMTPTELKSFTNMISTLSADQRLALMKELSALTAERRAGRLR
ncbi:MAG: hypothetical protein K2X93_13670 [Candidatus Obscuribacterales bacterium]|nr:hypothetical protein [Candidatus Obscuribacterales bacterium]